MQIARVIGDVVATVKDPNYDSIKLLLVQPIGSDGKDAGRPLVAVDSVGAGIGEKVFFVRGKEASFPWYPTEVPADAGIVGIIDHYTATEIKRSTDLDEAKRSTDLDQAKRSTDLDQAKRSTDLDQAKRSTDLDQTKRSTDLDQAKQR